MPGQGCVKLCAMRRRVLTGSIIIVIAMIALVFTSLQWNTLAAVRVSELSSAENGGLVGRRLRVLGTIGHQPVRSHPLQTEAGVVQVRRFIVVDGKERLEVEYHDALPDTFRPGGSVEVDGTYLAPGQMKAEHVRTKCPSKYEADEAKMKTGVNPASASGASPGDSSPDPA